MAGVGTYHFLPWLRRGVGAATPKATGALPARASLPLQLTVAATLNGVVTDVEPAATPVAVYGPGDIVGIDPNLVIRTEPRGNTTNFEPNYLAGIDFDLPDFPWLFTPDAAAGDRLAPWLALIVLKSDEFTDAAAATSPLPSIGITSIAALQDLSESWSFAHAQITSAAAIDTVLTNDPGHAISRILCPRRLDPETGYDAFLVPAFEIGRKAGLGLDVSSDMTTGAAWSASTIASAASPLPMPYYYRFAFHTSDEGDFESLVRRLVPVDLPPGVGQRSVAVDQPSANVPSAGPPLDFDGALIRVGTQPAAWSDPAKTAFQTALQTIVNDTAPAVDDPKKPDPAIVPPLYGRWHAGVASVDRTHAGWLDDLNLDPRRRTSSGFGTAVVQTERVALLASAWQQVGAVLAANRLLRQAQLARAAMVAAQTKHFVPAVAASLLAMTAPVHARLRSGAKTIAFQVRTSAIPARLLGGAFRRIARPLGPLRRRQAGPAGNFGTLIANVNARKLAIVPAVKAPAGVISIDQVSDAIVKPATTATTTVAIEAKTPAVARLSAQTLHLADLDPVALKAAAANPTFVVTLPGQTAPASKAAGTTDSADAAAFRSAITDLAAFLAVPQPVDPVLPALDVDAQRSAVLSGIDPAVTIPARALARITAPTSWKSADPIAPLMAAPTFPQAMYGPLRDLSQSYLLPGVENVPPDSVGLLQTNHAFVESYLVGLNHEMARQLLVDGYPTDQRGSYFRQFWDVSAAVGTPGAPDIPPINTWPLGTRLGSNLGPGPLAASVVLVVRGELLKRYPNTIIFAGKAVLDASTGELHLDESPGADQSYAHPIFAGTLAPDIAFFGFDLTADAALGKNPASPGYFFGFMQAPTEARFGLEPIVDPAGVSYWSELSWLNFASGVKVAPAPAFVGGYTKSRLLSTVFAAALTQGIVPAFVPATVQPANYTIGPGTDAGNAGDSKVAWGNDAAQAAYILFRRPYRIMVHAGKMLPSA